MSGISYKSLAQEELSDRLSLAELKITAQLLTELEFRRSQSELDAAKNKMLESIITNFKSNEELYELKIKNLELKVEEIKPSWYDHFWIGSAVTAIVVSSIYFMSK